MKAFVLILLSATLLWGEQEHFKKGRSEYFKGNLSAAIKAFKKAIEQEPQNSLYYFYLAKSYRKSARHKEAKQMLEKAILLNPAFWEAKKLLAELLMEQKDYKRAKKLYQEVLKKRPEDGEAALGVSKACIKLGDYKGAIQLLKRACQLQPKNPEAFFLLGRTYYETKSFPLAIIEFGNAIKLEPDNPIFYFWRANAYFANQDFRQPADEQWRSVHDYAKAFQLGLNNAMLHFMHANTLLNRAFYCFTTARPQLAEELLRAAIKKYRMAIEKDPSASNAYNNLGLAYFYLKRWDDAIRFYKKAIELQPFVAFFHDNLGDAYLKKGEYKSAIREWEYVLELEPQYQNKKYGWFPLASEDVREKIRQAKRLMREGGFEIYY